MTQRDKQTLFYVGGGMAALAVLAWFVYQWHFAPLAKYNRQIDNLENDVLQSKRQYAQLLKDKSDLIGYYQFLSLPHNPDSAAADYTKYLKPLLEKSGLTDVSFKSPLPIDPKGTATPAATAKKHLHTSLTFNIQAKGYVEGLISALKAMQSTPLAHRIKSLTLDRVDAKDSRAKLNIQMTVEALIINKAEPRPGFLAPDPRLLVIDSVAALARGPVGLALVPWAAGPMGPKGGLHLARLDAERNYHDIRQRNVFLGYQPPPPVVTTTEEPKDDPFDMREYFRLVSTDPLNKEAFLRNYAVKMPEMRLRPKAGFDRLKIMNEDRTKTLVDLKVLRIDQRDVYFLVNDDIYAIHIGQSLAEAMRRPLSDLQLGELGLVSFLPKEERKEDTKKKERPKLE